MSSKIVHKPYRLSMLGLVVILAATLSAQTPPTNGSSTQATNAQAPQLRFDVVSIRRNVSGSRQMTRQSAANTDNITMTNVPLAMAIFYAYHINDPNLVTGIPDWAWSERYDIVAKVDPADLPAYRALSNRQRGAMLQQVLEERCRLQAHRQTKDSAVYALVVTRRGPRLKVAAPGDTHPNTAKANAQSFAHGGHIFVTGPDQLTGEAATMADLALALSDTGHESLGRRVVDRTGLTGTYDFTLRFQPQTPSGEQADGQQRTDAIFNALEDQLGLRLQPATAPAEYLVIDRIERPSQN